MLIFTIGLFVYWFVTTAGDILALSTELGVTLEKVRAADVSGTDGPRPIVAAQAHAGAHVNFRIYNMKKDLNDYSNRTSAKKMKLQ